MDRDGVRDGYDLDQLARAGRRGRRAGDRLGRGGHARRISPRPSPPGASGALAASVFHDRRIAIPDLKHYLAEQGIEVRR